MILLIKHAPTEGPGLLGDFFTLTSWRAKSVELWNSEPLPSLEDCEAIISLGGPMNVHETEKFPFLVTEEIFLRDALSREIPILGICLGAQLLAHVSGAKVMKALQQEIGWYRVSQTQQGKADMLLDGLPECFDVFQWHVDTFTIPPGGSLIVTADGCRNQALRVGRAAWGLQFHPEMTAGMLAVWLTQCPDGFDRKLIMTDYFEKKDFYEAHALMIFSNFARSIMRRSSCNN